MDKDKIIMPNNILSKSQSVDYGTLPQDMSDMMSRVHQITANFNNRVDELFPEIRIKQEQERIRQEEKDKKDNLPWYAKLGYAAMATPTTSGDVPVVSPYASERWMVGDKEGAQSMQKTQDTIGSVAAGLSILGPYGIADFAKTAGTYGVGSALAAEGLSWGTGTAGYYGFNKLGNWIDNTHGTNTRKWLPLVGSMFTGMAGYNGYLRHGFGKNFGTIKFNRSSEPITDILQNYIADGSEQYVFDNGKNVLKVHVDNTSKNLKDVISYNKQWINGRNIVPGQVKLRHKGFIQDATTGNYYPVNSQLKADRILDDNMNVKDWERVINELKSNNGINIDGTFTKNRNVYKTDDFKPSNIGLYKNEPKFIDIDISKIK